MDDRIQYKLFNLEVTPPDNAWDSIESALNNEKAKTLISRFNQYAVTPPPEIWEKIDSELSGKTGERARVIPLNLRRLAAAAVFIGLLSTASWYYMQSGKEGSLASKAAATSLIIPDLSDTQNQAFKPSNPDASPALQMERIPNTPPVIRLSKTSDQDIGDEQVTARNYSTSDFQKNSTGEQAIFVNAPAIVGVDGRPVIDYQLLVSKDKNYVTVTSPNGQQTRISAKFLPVLSYLAGHSSTSLDTHEWKARIEQWKKRLLEDPDFIPAAGNFLDLPELTKVFDEQ
ncbi:MAG TPA: hypothetical protein VLC28_15910 [Flavitalea sp.]|nr:hypothetical protein [Flavitalea sp.]